MRVVNEPMPDLFLMEPTVIGDNRGFFYESFNHRRFEELTGVKTDFVQDNHSKSSKGVLRGLHFQKNPHAQAKLVRALRGSILDVAVDLRSGSPTFKQSYVVELSSDNKHQLFIPKGFAHAFVVLSEEAEVVYKTDDYYAPHSDSGIIFNDPQLNIDWRLPHDQLIISDKDHKLSTLEELELEFVY